MSTDHRPPKWDVDGVRGDGGVALAYNVPAETVLLVVMQRIAPGHIVNALYARRRTETQYRQIAGDDYTSADHVVTAAAVPIAYFVESTHGREDPGGSNTRAVVRVDLETLTMTPSSLSPVVGRVRSSPASRV